MGMEYSAQFQKLCQIEARRSLIIVGIVAIAYVMLQFFMLPYGNAFKFLLPDNEVSLSAKSGYSSNQSSVRAEKEGEINPSSFVEVVREDDKINDDDDVNEDDNVSKEFDRTKQDIVALEGNDRDESLGLDKPLKFLDVMEDNNSKVEADNAGKSEIVGLEDQNSFDSGLELNESSSFHGNENVESWNQANHLQAENVRKLPDSDLDVPKNDSEVMSVRRRKKVRPGMPPLSVTPIVKMNQILARHLASSSKMKPHWLPVYTPSPIYKSPVYTPSPAYKSPIYTPSPVYKSPVYTPSPVYKSPAYSPAPVYKTPTYTPSPSYGY